MATVTKPIALDESLNTTELSSRNVADVLAQELQAVVGAIGGIAVPSADHVSYDNSVSGLSATDVQNALDEIVSDIPTVNNGTLTIQQNGTPKGSFTANSASNVNVNIETPTADKKTATDQFTTADGGLLSKCQINLVPVQSGSGNPSPDNVRPISGHTEVDLLRVGKNHFDTSLLPVDNFGITIEQTSDGGIRIHGTPTYSTGYKSFVVGGWVTSLIGKTCTLSVDQKKVGIGWAVGTGDLNLTMADTVNKKTGTITTITESCKINISYNVGTIDETYYPQLELGSTETAFEPYLGHLYQVPIGSTVYGGTDEMVSGNLSDDTACDIYNGTETGWSTRTTAGGFRLFERTLSTSVIAPSSQVGLCNELKWRLDLDEEYSYRIYSLTLSVRIGSSASSLQDFYDWLDAHNLQITYPRATAVAISHAPQQIETLAGQNNLSTPLDGQSIETNGVEYKELFTFADVKSYVDKKIPDAPTTDGTYTLQAVVSGGVPTYSWV